MWDFVTDLHLFFKGLILIVLIALLALFFVYLPFLNHVSINQVGVAYNSGDGKVWTQDQPGWYWTGPLTLVTYALTVPFKVTIPSSAKVINTKVVRFDPAGMDEYIRLQGWDYSMSNDIVSAMLGYAYSGQSFKFMVIMQEAGSESAGSLRPLTEKQP